jgi:ribose 5-phosphate isomerase A
MSSGIHLKKLVGFAAVDRFVTDGMTLGLGTGSTAIWAVRRVSERFHEGVLKGVRIVTTSLQSEIEASSRGLPIVSLNDPSLAGGLDLAIDGADEIDPKGNLIKGGGGALLMEKIVAYASRRFIVVADDSKLSRRLCEHFAIPVEIVPAALAPVTRALEALGAEVSLRMAVKKAGPVVTDHGNLLLDAAFSAAFDPPALERELKLIPGVLENGLFTKKTPELLIVHSDGRIEHRNR